MDITREMQNPLFKKGFYAGFSYKLIMDEFNEDDHPRDETGKFTDSEGSSGGSGESTTVTVPRNYECRLSQKLGREHYDKIHDIIDNCPHDGLKEMWARYEKGVGVSSTDYHKNCCIGQDIYINLEECVNGDTCNEPYQIAFHEIAHAMDNTAALGNHTGESGYWCISYNYNNNEFGKTLQEEYDNMIKDYTKEAKEDFKEHAGDYEYLNEKGYIRDWEMKFYEHEGKFPNGEPKYSKSMIYRRIETEISKIPSRERGDLSDIFDGCSNGKINGGCGHDTGYWKKEKCLLSMEAFAEMTSSNFTNPKSTEHIKRYFPKSYGVYEKIIDTYK